MTEYIFEVFKGTENFIVEELNEKYPNINIVEITKGFIKVKSEIEKIENFYNIKSALRVKKENGFQINLYRRDWRKKTSPAGINPSLAYILCKISNITKDDVVLDPFCGGGTIAITASTEFEPKKVLASDVSGKAVDMTMFNFNNAHVNKTKYNIFRSNISQLKLQKNSVDKVITNLPFGIRSGNHEENIKTYQHISDRLSVIMKKNSYLVMYTLEKKLLREVIDGSFFELEEEYLIEVDKLFPSIFIYKKIN